MRFGRTSSAIDVIDLRHETGNAVDFLRPDTDLVCFSVNWDREAAFVHEQIRSIPPGIRTIVGGRHVTQNPEPWLSKFPNIDIVVRGDGEEIIEEILQDRPLEDIAGISYRVADPEPARRRQPTGGRSRDGSCTIPCVSAALHGTTSTRTGACAATRTRSIRAG